MAFGNMMMLSGEGRGSANIVISSNQTDWNLITDGLGGVAPVIETDILITINASIDVVASLTSVPAMDLTGIIDGSTISIVNNGNIYGAGGDGGDGRDCNSILETSFCGGSTGPGSTGGAGGPAIQIDGDVDLDLTNASGRLWAGGGGGGGGDACEPFSANCCCEAGGGGGGGAGGSAGAGKQGAFGVGGDATGDCTVSATDGNAGTGGVSGAGGSGGAKSTGGDCSGGGDGGAGGAFGAAGTNGLSGGTSGGAAGLAVDNNGTGTTSFTSGGTQGVDLKGTAE